jgi:16S rRNA (adenine1518-N6/adenine1519-N6)-dimethyltransferase
MSGGLDDLPPLREVVATHGLAAKKTLGQNFIFDLNLTARIARQAGPLEGARVIEVGPGPGGLTRALLAGGAEVFAIERDERCLAALAEIAARYPGRLHVLAEDALATDFSALASRAGDRPTRICANLPYNIATALLTGWVEAEPWPPWFDRLVLMFQREVAERIVASPRERAAYGRLAVLCNWRCATRILFDVPPQAFTPPPKVTSSVVELIPREKPLPCDARALAAVTHAAFGQRRKMLRQALRPLGLDPLALLEAAGIEPTRRAEEIEIDGFVALARAFVDLRGVCEDLRGTGEAPHSEGRRGPTGA